MAATDVVSRMSFANTQISKNKTANSNRLSLPERSSNSFYRRDDNFVRKDYCNPLIDLRRTINNQEFQNLLPREGGFDFAKIGIFQPKLRISQPGDEYEREADKISEDVMRMSSDDSVIVSGVPANGKRIDRKCGECQIKTRTEEEEKNALNIRRKKSNPTYSETDQNSLSQPENLNSGNATSLDEDTREFMESRLGYDFSSVKIHTDETATRSAQYFDALAYTIGNDIIFGQGQYDPNTLKGKRLLAHELAHVVQQRTHHMGQLYLQRSCVPTALPPIAPVPLGGSGFNWLSAEICMQEQYPYKGIVGTNKNWRFLSAPPGSVEQRDLEVFKSHLVAKSGMFLAEPDIIDFTRAEIYDVTTIGQAPAHQIRMWADTGLATSLAFGPGGTGREWIPGTWEPNPWYWLGGDQYMNVYNDGGGLLIYNFFKDVSKEVLTAVILAAILAATKNMIKKALATALVRNPYVAAALAAIIIIVVITTDAELAFAAEGDPIENLIKAIENSGETLPDEIKEALKNDPDLRASIEAASKEKDPSEKAKKLSKACLEVIAKNKDKFSREDLEALLTMVQIAADDKLPDKAPTVEALKKQAEKIRKGEIPDPEASTTGGKDPAKAGKGKTTADIEKEVRGDKPTLKPETVKNIAAAPELARKLLDRLASKTGDGKPLTDEDIERVLASVPSDLTQAQFDSIIAKLEEGTTQEPSELIANLEKHIAAAQKEQQAATSADLEKKHPKLSPEAREKLAKASPAARRMLEAVAATGLGGVALTDVVVDRFLQILSEAITPEQVEAIVQGISKVKPDDNIDAVLSNLEKAVRSKAKPVEKPGGETSGGKGTGEKTKGIEGGHKGKSKAEEPSESELLVKLLVLLAGKVVPNQTRLEWDGNDPVTGTRKIDCRFFGKSIDGMPFIARVSVVFIEVKHPQATYRIIEAGKIYNLDAEVITPDKPLVGQVRTIKMDEKQKK